MNEADIELDARGLICPMPVLKAKKILQSIESGQILKILITDEAALKDIPVFCEMAGHTILAQQQEEAAHVFFIRKDG